MTDPRNLIIGFGGSLLMLGAVSVPLLIASHGHQLKATKAEARLEVEGIKSEYALRDKDREIETLRTQLEQAEHARRLESSLIARTQSIERVRDDLITAAEANPDLDAPIDPALLGAITSMYDRMYGDTEAGTDVPAAIHMAGDSGDGEDRTQDTAAPLNATD